MLRSSAWCDVSDVRRCAQLGGGGGGGGGLGGGGLGGGGCDGLAAFAPFAPLVPFPRAPPSAGAASSLLPAFAGLAVAGKGAVGGTGAADEGAGVGAADEGAAVRSKSSSRACSGCQLLGSCGAASPPPPLLVGAPTTAAPAPRAAALLEATMGCGSVLASSAALHSPRPMPLTAATRIEYALSGTRPVSSKLQRPSPEKALSYSPGCPSASTGAACSSYRCGSSPPSSDTTRHVTRSAVGAATASDGATHADGSVADGGGVPIVR